MKSSTLQTLISYIFLQQASFAAYGMTTKAQKSQKSPKSLKAPKSPKTTKSSKATTKASKGLKTPKSSNKLTVMTQYVYFGADLDDLADPNPPLDLFPFCAPTNPAFQLCLPSRIAAIFQTMVDSDFPARAEKMVDNVAIHEPDIIALQSVGLVRKEVGSNFPAPPSAVEVVIDQLQVFEDALSAKGLSYTVVSQGTTQDYEFPALEGFVSPTEPILNDNRLTIRNVILVKSGIVTQNPSSGIYTDKFSAGSPFPDTPRGWTAVDVKIGKHFTRIFNTQLEPGLISCPLGSDGERVCTTNFDLQYKQATELVSLLPFDDDDDDDMSTIVLGSINAGSRYGVVVDGNAYEVLTDEGTGLVDSWSEVSDEPGNTCCIFDDGDVPTYRQDYIFPPASSFEVSKVVLVGGDESDKVVTPKLDFPSYQLGIVATLEFKKTSKKGKRNRRGQ